MTLLFIQAQAADTAHKIIDSANNAGIPIAPAQELRFGDLLISGGVIVAIGYTVILIDFSTIWSAIISSTIGGVGISLAFAAMPTLILRSVPATESAAANGLNSLMRSIGTTVAAALVGTILATITRPVGGFDLPTAEAFRLACVIALSVSLASAAIAAFIPKHVARPAGEHPALPAAGD